MGRVKYREARILIAGLCIVLAPALARSQQELSSPNSPAISQQLVREGDFAVKLHSSLGLGTVEDEAEAESNLGKAGIIPRNGWIADYPVTPDIMGELQKAVGDSATGGKLTITRSEALEKLQTISGEFSLNIKPHAAVTTNEATQDETAAEDYPNPAQIDDYYQAEGPPIVTYYAPPSKYYYLYGWIPYPFWSAGFWFPGYFILNDFYRPFHSHNRISFVSNHFNDLRSHHVFRVDPVARFNGRTFAGIGVTNRRGFISTGVQRSGRAIFNAPRAQASPGMRSIPGTRPSYSSTGGTRSTYAPAARSTGRTFSAPSQGGGRRSVAPRGGTARTTAAPSGGREGPRK
jgi:hypothetical protein